MVCVLYAGAESSDMWTNFPAMFTSLPAVLRELKCMKT